MKSFFILFVYTIISLNLIAQEVPLLEIDGNGTGEDMITFRNNNYSRIASYTFSNDFEQIPVFAGYKSRGTILNPTAVQPGDRITGFYGLMNIGTEYATSAAVEAFVGSSVSSSSSPSFLTFGTTNKNSIIRTEKMRITEEGNVGIGAISPSAKLEVSDGDVYIDNFSNGVIMKSPNGDCWRFQADNSGALISTSIVCPN